jgi:hypothetical protein
MREMAMFAGSRTHLTLWSRLEDTLLGDSASTIAFGRPVFEHFEDDVEFARHFHGAMACLSRVQSTAVLRAHDFASARSICDVGGGTGTLLAEILRAHPQARGVLFDLPEVVRRASSTLEEHGVADRVDIVGGSFFDSVPRGADRYVLQSIVHDWDDGSAVEILRHTRAAMSPGARALVIEQVLPRGPTGHPSRSLDMEMLVVTEGGRERTHAGYEALFERAGLTVHRGVEAPPLTVFELVG